MRDVRTIHGTNGANARADNRHRLTLLGINRVDVALGRYQAHLPSAPSANRPPQGPPTLGPTSRFKPTRTDPLNREPAAESATVPFKPFRTDSLNREPTAEPATAPFKPSRTDPLNREPTAKPGSAVPFKPSRIDPLNREPTAKPGPTARRVAGSNASSADAIAQPTRAHDPASRPGQSGEGSKVRPAPAEAGGAAQTLLPSPDCPGCPSVQPMSGLRPTSLDTPRPGVIIP